ncbi:MAG: hypothetical protein RLZZ293_157 [Pseudomonadota bacterium]|jgi:hypothetical protein
MKPLYPAKLRFSALGAVLALATLVGCSGHGSTASSVTPTPTPTPPTPVVESPVAISVMSVVPVINGSATTGSLTIVNNSSYQVTNLVANVVSSNSTNKSSLSAKTRDLINSTIGQLLGKKLLATDDSTITLLDPNSCSTIDANKDCTLKFETPNLSLGDAGSSLVNFTYSINNTDNNTMNALVNYQYESALPGVHFSANSQPNIYVGKGDSTYVTGYLYAGGDTGTKYNYYLDANQPAAISVAQGDVSSADHPVEIVSGEMHPVLLKINSLSSESTFLTMTPKYTTTLSTSKVVIKQHGLQHQLQAIDWASGTPYSINLIPQASAVNLIFSTASNLMFNNESSAAQKTQTITVVNTGNLASGAVTASVVGSGLTVTGTCTSLSANTANSCTFSAAVTATSTGSATVNFSTGGSVVGSQTISWVNFGTYIPKLIVSSSTATLPDLLVGESAIIPFTVSNIGTATVNLTTPTFNNEITGIFTPTVQAATTCGATLAAGQSCIYSYKMVALTSAGASQLSNYSIRLTESGNYNGNPYSASLNPGIAYTIGQPIANFVFTSPVTPTVLTINANGTESKTQTFTVKNVGTGPGDLNTINLGYESATRSKPVINGGTCQTGVTYQRDATCTIIVKYGPIPYTESQNESGITSLNVGFYAESLTTNSSYINYNVIANDIYLSVESVVGTNLSNGQGTSSSPFFGYPKNGSMSIKVTFKNQSLNSAMRYLNFNTQSLPAGLKVESSSSTCKTGSQTMTLESGATCDLVISLDTDYLKVSSNGAQNVLNFTLPNMSWQTTNFGVYKESGNLFDPVYVNYLQPTITFTAHSIVTGSSSFGSVNRVMLNVQASNESTVSSLSTSISAVKAYYGSSPESVYMPIATSGCTLNSSDWSLSCNLTGSVESIVYNLPTSYLAQIPLTFTTPNIATLAQSYLIIQWGTSKFWKSLNTLSLSSPTKVVLASSSSDSANPNGEANVYAAFLPNANVYKLSATGESWVAVGSGTIGTTPSDVSLAIDSNSGAITPYVAVINGDSTAKASVYKFSGSSWTKVGSDINAGASGKVTAIALAINSTTHNPVLAFVDDSNNKIYLQQYNGSAWSAVGSTSGLSVGNASSISLSMAKTTANLAFVDAGNSNKLSLINLSTADGAESKIYTSSSSANYTSVTTTPSGYTYLAFADGSVSSKASVVKCFKGVCSLVGTAGSASATGTAGLNIQALQTGLYLSSIDSTTGNLKVYFANATGNTWSQLGDTVVGSNVTSAGLAMSYTWEFPYVFSLSSSGNTSNVYQ